MDIYAELSKKLCAKVNEGAFFRLPDGVSLSRKNNSRYCYFTCGSKDGARELTNTLDYLGIPWQEN